MCNWKKLAIFAVVMTIVTQIIRIIESLLTMNYYLDPAYFSVWSKIMMPVAGPPPTSFFILSAAAALLSWALFVIVYEKLGSALTEKDPLKKGATFGFLVYLVAGLPMNLSFYLLINLPVGLIISWAISMLILDLIGGVIVAKIYDGKKV